VIAPTSSDKGIAGRDGPIARHLNRPLSKPISERTWQHPITPDQWESRRVRAGLRRVTRLRGPDLNMTGLLVHAGSVVDSVDGAVPRLQGTDSAEGALFDLTLDRISDVGVLAGLAMGAGGRKRDWLLALVAANGILTASVVKERGSTERISPSSLHVSRRKPVGSSSCYRGQVVTVDYSP